MGSIVATTDVYAPVDVHFSRLVFRASAGGVAVIVGDRLSNRAARSQRAFA